MTWLEGLLQDSRSGVLQLRKNPLFHRQAAKIDPKIALRNE